MHQRCFTYASSKPCRLWLLVATVLRTTGRLRTRCCRGFPGSGLQMASSSESALACSASTPITRAAGQVAELHGLNSALQAVTLTGCRMWSTDADPYFVLGGTRYRMVHLPPR